MNITHIMAQTMYTQDMYMLINTCFDGTEHKFCTAPYFLCLFRYSFIPSVYIAV